MYFIRVGIHSVYLIFLLFVLFYICPTNAQTSSQQAVFQSWGLDDGLEISFVLDINEDTDGNIWLAGYEDVIRFDGHHFISIASLTGTPFFSPKTFLDIGEHRLLVMGESGAAVIDTLSLTVDYITQPDSKLTFRSGAVTQKGLFLGGSDGLYFASLKNGDWVLKKTNLPKPFNGYVSHLFSPDDDNLVMAIREKGIVKYSPVTGAISVLVDKAQVKSIYAAQLFDDELWFGDSDKAQIYRYKLQTKTLSQWNLKEGNFATSFSKVSSGEIWITAYGARTHIIDMQDMLQLYLNETTTRGGLENNQLSSSLTKDGTLWLGGGRLYRSVAGAESFRWFYDSAADSSSVYEFSHYSDDKFWVLTDNNLLLINKAPPFNVIARQANYSAIYGMVTLYNGDLLLSHANGLNRVTYNGELLSSHYQLASEYGSHLEVLSVRDKQVYGFSDSQFLKLRFNGDDLEVQALPVIADNIQTFTDPMLVAELNGVTYFINSKSGGLYEFDEEHELLIHRFDLSDIASFNRIDLNDVVAMGDELVIASMYDGLFMVNPSLRTLTKKDLTGYGQGRTIYSLETSAEAEEIWLTTEKALVRLNISTGKVTAIGMEHNGLFSTSFYDDSNFRDAKGQLFWGTQDGFVSFHETLDIPFDTPREPSIRGVSLNYQARSFLANLTLEHQQNHIRFAISSPSFSQQGDIHFRFRLRGITDSWTDLNPGESNIDFSLLPAGEFELQVKASDSLGNQSATAIFPFSKTAPPWRTPFAIAFYVVLIVISIVLFIKFREMRLRRYHVELEEKVAYRTLQLEDSNIRVASLMDKQRTFIQNKNEFIATIAHDIKSPLNTAQLALEQTKKSIGSSEPLQIAQNKIQSISTSVKHLLDSVAMSTVYGDEKSPINLSCKLRTAVEKHAAYSRKNRITSRLYIDKEIVFDGFDVDIELLISNVITNAIMHSSSGGIVEIRLQEQNAAIVLVVQNTIDADSSDYVTDSFVSAFRADGAASVDHKHFGLLMIKNVVFMHDGEVQFEVISDVLSVVITLPVKTAGKDDKVLTYPSSGPSVCMADSAIIDATKPFVLFIDDDSDFHHILYDCFAEKYQLKCALDGMEALQVCHTLLPDVIVYGATILSSDIEIFMKEKRRHPRLKAKPCVFLFAESRISQQVELMKLGADIVLEKSGNLRLLEAYLHRFTCNEVVASQDSILQPYKDTKSDTHERIDAVIMANYQDADFDVTQLCELLGMSYRTFVRRISEFTKHSPQEMINAFRCEKAILLLEEGVKTESVVDQSGFSSAARMRHWFNHFYKKPPRAFREHKQQFN